MEEWAGLEAIVRKTNRMQRRRHRGRHPVDRGRWWAGPGVSVNNLMVLWPTPLSWNYEVSWKQPPADQPSLVAEFL